MNTNFGNEQFNIASLELVYINDTREEERAYVEDSAKAFEVFLTAWDMNKIEMTEQFMIMLLDRANSCIGISIISSGGSFAATVDPKIVFATALKAGASQIVMAQNRTGTDLEPTYDDVALTWKIRKGGEMLDVEIRDHLILTKFNYYSMVDDKLLDKPDFQFKPDME